LEDEVGLVGGDVDGAIGGEGDFHNGGFFAEGGRGVVAKAGVPPVARFVLKTIGAAAAGHGFMPLAAGAENIVADGGDAAVADPVKGGAGEAIFPGSLRGRAGHAPGGGAK